jgi:hypothetical protein
VPKAFSETPTVRLGQYALWHDPGAVETLDFRYGIGGPGLVPQPPFAFVEEDTSGTNSKVQVKDANGRSWAIKFGEEASPDTFCTRLAWSAGYYVEPTYFVADGVIGGVHGLQRARKAIDDSGRFRNARFQLRSKEPKFLRMVDWSWSDNPFLGTPELNGLKILMMLVSNWDDKDSRDSGSRGSNTAIYQEGNLLFYFIDDWGGAMGNWGKLLTRSKWDDDGFYRQSTDFLKVGKNGLQWGYSGQHTELMIRDLKFTDVAWLLRYLGRVTDDQLRAGLLSSGASDQQAQRYLEALRIRIGELQQAAGTVSR